jgi:hypothetical protein
MNVPGKGKVVADLRRERRVDDSGAVHHTLALEGAALPRELTEVFRDSP